MIRMRGVVEVLRTDVRPRDVLAPSRPMIFSPLPVTIAERHADEQAYISEHGLRRHCVDGTGPDEGLDGVADRLVSPAKSRRRRFLAEASGSSGLSSVEARTDWNRTQNVLCFGCARDSRNQQMSNS